MQARWANTNVNQLLDVETCQETVTKTITEKAGSTEEQPEPQSLIPRCCYNFTQYWERKNKKLQKSQ